MRATKKVGALLFITSVFLMNLAATVITPVLPYFIINLGIDMKVYGGIGTATSVVNLFLRIPFSTLIPIIGYFSSLALGGTILFVSRIFYVLSSLGIWALYTFIAAYFFSSARFSFIMIARSSIVARFTPQTRRGMALGGIASIGTIASSIGPFIGSYLYEHTESFTVVFAVSAALSLLAVIILFPLLRNDIKGKVEEASFRGLKDIAKILRFKKLRNSLIVFAVDAFSWSIAFMYTSIYLAQEIGATPTDLAIISFISSTVGAVGFAAAGYVSDRFKTRKIFLFISEVFGIIYFSIYVFSRNINLFYIAALMMGFVMSFWGPIATAYITERGEEISREVIPVVLGVRSFILGLARTPGGIVGGILYDISPTLLFQTALLLVFVSSVLILLLVEE